MKIHPNIVCELVGDEIVVMDSGSSSVMSITGHGATAVKRVLSGEMVGKDELGVSELLAQGILIPETSDSLTRRSLMMASTAELALRELVEPGIVSAPGLSRRGLIKAGAIGAGASIAVLSFPSAAMASSGPRIALTGTWGEEGNDGIVFATTGFDFDNSLGNSDDGGTDPSSLSVQAPPAIMDVVEYIADGDAADDRVLWAGDDDGRFTAAVDGRLTLVGSFTWDGTLFTVTFTFVAQDL